MGYHRAGFDEIVGVDIASHKNYPFTFVLGDALEYLEKYGREFDAVHASPPCQSFVVMARHHRKPRQHVDLLTPTLAALSEYDRPYVVENVMTAPVPATVVLCGSSFGLKVRRHRKFASNFFIPSLPCRHAEQGRPIGVYGHSFKQTKDSWLGGLRARTKAEACEAMGIDWMTVAELCEAIPPAYTEYIGGFLLEYLR